MNFGIAYATKKRAKKMAEGGDVKGVHEPLAKTSGTSAAGMATRSHANIQPFSHDNEMKEIKGAHKAESISRHKKVLAELKAMPKPKLMAEGGEVESAEFGEQNDQHELDMVDNILRKHYSKGGEVSNDVGVSEADEAPAEFDDLVLDDGLEFHETEANSGDDLGDEQEDHDRADIISRILKSRSKKDRMPRPA